MSTIIKARKTKFPPLLHLTYILQQSSDEFLLREVGVSLSQARIMSGLDLSMSISQRHLASSLSQTEANISRQLQHMKGQGLVSITKNKKDGRQRDVKLTRKGAGKYDKAEKVLIRLQKTWYKQLDQSEDKAFSLLASKLNK